MIDINKMRLLVQDYKLAGSPVFVQAADMNEILDRLEEAERASAHIKKVEFPRKMRAVAAGWETKCARLEQERDALPGAKGEGE